MDNKINFKLVNIILIFIIGYLIYQTSNLWFNLLSKIFKIIIPLIIAFAIAYILYPFLKKLKKNNISTSKAVLIIVFILTAFFSVCLLALIPLMYKQIIHLFDYIVLLVKELSNIESNFIRKTVIDILTAFTTKYYSYISVYALKTVSVSINIIINFIIIFIFSIYFLINMDKIRAFLKNIRNEKLVKYLKIIDIEMNNYFNGFLKLIIISFIEYTLLYLFLGHPDFLLFGFLSAISNFIPYFGYIFVELLALLTSFSTNLSIKILIFTFIFGIIDSYILNPFIYRKSNKIPSIVIVISIFSFSILFGIIGVIISVPLGIIIISTIKYFKEM